MEISEGSDFRGVGGLVKRLIHPSTTGSINLGVSIAFVNPGEELPPHKHPNEEAYFILQGEGIMTIEDCAETINLKKYLSVYIPANKDHYTKNTGNEPLVMLCSLAPPPVAK
jgi:mannose-6-phosphate isomerase-like protein (cupin superfamily)